MTVVSKQVTYAWLTLRHRQAPPGLGLLDGLCQHLVAACADRGWWEQLLDV